MRRSLLSLATILLILPIGLPAGPAFAEWKYLVPDDGQPNVHRAFAFAEKSDDRLEFACNGERIDIFYTTEETVSEQDLDRLKAGKPIILLRLEGTGVVPLDSYEPYQKSGRLYFVSSVKPAFITDLGKSSKPFASGMQAAGEIVRQDMFSTEGLEAAMSGLADGCGF